jgi:dinuclear metal center YbgI/SA1388 family protein
LSTPLSQVVRYLDGLLRTGDVPDYANALNGLQVSGERDITRLAVAVDAVQATIDAAAAAGADLLIVHHGLFWDGNQPIVGRRYRRLRALFDAGMALYSAHLPLDVHPEFGNSAVLAREMGVEVEGTFGEYKGHPLGVRGTLDLRREALCARLDEVLGVRVRMLPFGPERVRSVGIVTGGAADMIGAARAAELDAFVTGEAAHHNYFDAEEGGINLYLGGHYATEVWGVRALGAHLEERFGIPWSFIEHSSGL